ncbi:MAG TPA: class I SAM-dependent methyltransferase [Candidatus Acidoferrales bacterium]|jgi:SAM-dependent methyltransferase|nr:class I SAM-dependent methyltransferase [Candidatus Acidoferrales bacterium]
MNPEEKRPAVGLAFAPTVQKGFTLLRKHGPVATAAVITSVIEDGYLRMFDRRYAVRTSGYLKLEDTSLGADATKRGHRYRAVNAWAFKRVLAKLAPGKNLRFVDLGCGLGRACLLAAEYGFSRVRGVDMVPEFCTQAKDNAKVFAAAGKNYAPVEILQADAVDYSLYSDDDIIFLYNPFPVSVLEAVVDNLIGQAGRRQQPVFIIYSERILETDRTLAALRQKTALKPVLFHSSWGQAFHVFKVG